MATVSEILGKKGGTVSTVPPETSVLQATRLMNEKRIGSLLVTVADGRVVGMFTERDVLTRVVAAGRDPVVTTVGEVMTTPVAYVTPDTPLEECGAIVTQKRIRHLPVIDGERLVGLITSGDLVAHEVHTKNQTIRYLEEYIQSA